MHQKELTILGIETSCDETAASLIKRHPSGSGECLSSIVRSQLKEHARFGGVVPEIAARAHVEALDKIIAAALEEAGVEFSELDGIAATAGPGLIGGLLVGIITAKAIALVHNLPFIAVNHLEAHALTPGLTNNIKPPYLVLLVSGGHTQLQWVSDVNLYTRIGTTLDDAVGEAFDKTAKLLGLGFPGGPEVEKWAKSGDKTRFKLPRPLRDHAEPNFSFSGLKTALRQQAEQRAPLSDTDIADLCASFQNALIDSLINGIEKSLDHPNVQFTNDQPRNFIVSGGVAANQALRAALDIFAANHNLNLVLPPVAYCTDNAAMIAWAGGEQLARGISHPLDFAAKSRWPLDKDAKPLIGAGKAGAKA